MTTAVRSRRRGGICDIAAAVFGDAHSHLGTDGHEHDKRQTANENAEPNHSIYVNVSSKVNLNGSLHETGRGRAHHMSEIGIGVDTIHGLRTIKLRMVENIEGLHPNIQGHRFSKADGFAKLHVKVLDAGPLETSPAGATQNSQRLYREIARIEHRFPVARVLIQVQRTAQILGRVQQVIVHAVAQGSQKRVVGVVNERYGQP